MVSRNTEESLRTLGYIICGLVAGWLNWRVLPFRSYVLTPPQLLPFLVVGVAGGLIYAGTRLRGFGYGMMMVGLLFFLQLALMPPLRPETVIRAGLWALPVGLSFLFAGVLFKLLVRWQFGKFLLMGMLVGIGYMLVLIFFRLRAQEPIFRQQLAGQFVLGAMLGGFLGILIEGVEFIFPLRRFDNRF
jgi:hypothetical protein|uniref:Uncharacterized protein n=1 Tax=candidate division WOR-3 bacterium TaxID=2052148 RepID=A0A7V3PUV8_UNCW3